MIETRVSHLLPEWKPGETGHLVLHEGCGVGEQQLSAATCMHACILVELIAMLYIAMACVLHYTQLCVGCCYNENMHLSYL